MINYIGNCSALINWDLVIRELEDQKPAYVGPKHKEGDPIPQLKEVTDLWNTAGYKTAAEGGTVAWDMFFPGDNFDSKVADDSVILLMCLDTLPVGSAECGQDTSLLNIGMSWTTNHLDLMLRDSIVI